MKHLFSITLYFSNHLIGIGQHEAESPETALDIFIKTSESLREYDRVMLLESVIPFIQHKNQIGMWSYSFHPKLLNEKWPNDNPVYGGHIIQTDPNSPTRN